MLSFLEHSSFLIKYKLALCQCNIKGAFLYVVETKILKVYKKELVTDLDQRTPKAG